MEVISPCLKELWNEWQLRALVLLSLTLQIILIILGKRRTYVDNIWIRAIVWSAYLSADTVATGALGVLTSNLFQNAGQIDANMELRAFWAPFLLLHLGGPDTITACSLEDNELWSRHLLQLVVQTGFAVYIFLMAWTGSHLSILAIPLMFAGLIKYGERTWVLWSASYERLRVSIMSIGPDPSSRFPSSISRYILNEDEGYIVRAERGTAVHFPINLSDIDEDNSMSEEDKLATADRLLDMSKPLFIDAEISTQTRDTYPAVLHKLSGKNALEVIEMELGFMYDMLYAKAMVAHTPWGLGLRFISFLLTCIVLVLFSLAYHKHKYLKADLSITFLLSTVAVLLEVYAALVLLSLDQTIVWLRKHNRSTISKAITAFSPLRNRRWSNSVGQYSKLSYCIKEKHLGFQRILKLVMLSEKLEMQWYPAYNEIPSNLKDWLFKSFLLIYSAAAASISFKEFYTRTGMLSMKDDSDFPPCDDLCLLNCLSYC